MKISSEGDIIPYLEQIIFSHPIFKMTRERAIISALSFVESDFQRFKMNTSLIGGKAVYNRLRSAQDILKYSLFHIINNDNENTTTQSLQNTFDSNIYNLYKKYQIIHDCLQGVKIGQVTCRIRPEEKTVIFNVPSTAIINRKREWKELLRLQKKANKFLEDLYPETASEIRKSLLPAFDGLSYDEQTKSLMYNTSEDVIAKAYELIVLKEPNTIYGPKLPQELDLGSYTAEDLRLFWRYLSAITLIHSLAFKFAEERGLNHSNTAALLIIKKEDLLEKISVSSGLSRTISQEIFRDLTYDPINVKWTEPQYQPLIPISDDRIVIAALLILSNNYERNYAVLVEKLNWRHDAQIKLKESHEDDMISRITEGIGSLGLEYEPCVKLREDGKEVSDIDLVIWANECEYILLLSLKWFYGPDSVQEVANHAKRYREANKQQKRIIEFANGQKSKILQKCGIEFRTAGSKTFLPLIIYEEDMPLEQERDKDLPATTINRFIRIQCQKGKNLNEVYSKIKNEYNSYPALEGSIKYQEYDFGEYTFKIPEMIVNREGNYGY
jgi:hypothetical protein